MCDHPDTGGEGFSIPWSRDDTRANADDVADTDMHTDTYADRNRYAHIITIANTVICHDLLEIVEQRRGTVRLCL